MKPITELPKICVILGAGASTAVHNGSAPILHGNFKPPLARDLFAIGKHADYFDLLHPYPGAEALASLLSPASELGEFNLEKRLKQPSVHHDERVQRQFKYVPPYLRDLLWKASHHYTPSPGTYLQLVYSLLADFPHHVLFLILNYDTLLEQALGQFDPSFVFDSMDSYIRNERQAKVIKVHGSIDWFKLIGGLDRSWDDLVLSQDVLRKALDTEIHVDGKVGTALSDQHITHNRLYPVLTAPLAGKETTDMVCPTTHVDFAGTFLKDCRKLLVIGTSGLDEDLLAFLDARVDPTIKPYVQLVGLEDGEQVLARFEGGVRAFCSGKLDPPPCLFTDGFRPYVDSGQLAEFAQFDPSKMEGTSQRGARRQRVAKQQDTKSP